MIAPLAEPKFDYDDLDHFAAYHSNPPHTPGEFAARTVNAFGRGRVVYLASSLLARQHHAQQTFGEWVLREFAPPSALLHACDTPPTVEVTLLRSTRGRSMLVTLVNYQDDSPFLPLYDLTVTITPPPGTKAGACRIVSSDAPITPARDGPRLTLRLPRLDLVEMIDIVPA